ncbi:AFL176Cp [Eremothecium gossypii ATCC 10895]|uniref:Vacuolar protein sorting-associated protein 27 n=1 Tax=Eremothecium gossypii (strain ATCC 10895 / CBS 109.51 / FGSC 9923 / NRRL Y-1056) TaxID=284811 RepID=VPS27_EREGS|nr:AFL176Cp [Eremothecium gossypii ATCC 10895]Q755J9.1 RecName: Full=Vacuolar protein sorting-associated protein 27 [Eremothecium gossypii ATCC 10895]AAS53198.1 AFL176Cp [Eremothecium gossypii ATCC 10895]AEY97508.1 FAFL176Cp [Eremothecium gossypii FDAG1]
MNTEIQTVAALGECIQRATSESIPNGEIDLALALDVSDAVRSRRLGARDSMRALKKRVLQTKSNPNTQLAAWRLVEVCVKNGGTHFLKEVCSREFMDCMEHVAAQEKTVDNEDLVQLCRRIIFELYTAFKNDSQLSYVSQVHQRLQARGVEFPQAAPGYLVNTMAMFDSKAPADWVDSDACMICSNAFTFLNRKHHCRSCGGIFCNEHSSHQLPLPEMGITEPVRVCDNCYDEYEIKKHSSRRLRRQSQRRARPKAEREDEDDDLRRAIELSLRESKTQDNLVPTVTRLENSDATKDDEDPEFLAAVQASLREHQLEQERQAAAAAAAAKHPSQPERAVQLPSLMDSRQAPVAQQRYSTLTNQEEDDIYLFANLVEKMKGQPMNAVLEDTQLQMLYQKVLGTRPRLNHSLNDTFHKYNTLVDMNAKISDIMSIYDTMLERQLRNINLSQQYSMPHLPSDPYTYQMHRQPESSPANTVPYEKTQPEPTYRSYARSSSNAAELTPAILHTTQSSPMENRQSQSVTGFEPQVSEPDIKKTLLSSPSEPLYPPEESIPDKEKEAQVPITQFEFPSVPAQKIKMATPQNERVTEDAGTTPQEETLLIEL